MKKLGYIFLSISIIFFSMAIINNIDNSKKYYFTTNGVFSDSNPYSNGSFDVNEKGRVNVSLKISKISTDAKPKISLTSPAGENILLEGNDILSKEIETKPGKWLFSIDGDNVNGVQYSLAVWMENQP